MSCMGLMHSCPCFCSTTLNKAKRLRRRWHTLSKNTGCARSPAVAAAYKWTNLFEEEEEEEEDKVVKEGEEEEEDRASNRRMLTERAREVM